MRRLLPLALTLVALLLIAARVLSAPAPRVLAHAPAASARDLTAPDAGTALEAACASDATALARQLAEHAALPERSAQPTTHSRDVGAIAVLEDPGTFFYTNSGGRPLLDIAEVTKAYYRTHDDDVDFIAITLASGLDQWLGSPGALAAAWLVRNDTQGIGLLPFDLGAAMGSPARLQSVLTMNGLHRYPADPDASIGGGGDTFSTLDVYAHEFAHRWLAYTFLDSAGSVSSALLGRDYQHWSFFFDSDSSYMEGCDWAVVRPDSFVTDGVSSTFGALDRYLMGLTDRSELEPFFTVADPTAFSPPGTYIPISIPAVGVGCRGRAATFTLDDLERLNGPRIPAGSSTARTYRVAFVLVTPPGSDATTADLAKLDLIRTRFAGTIGASTRERMQIDTALHPRPGRLVIAHRALLDTEDDSAPRAVGVRVSIVDGAQGLTVDPASVMLHWRTGANASATTLDVPMQPAGPDSFAAFLPPQPLGTQVAYTIEAASTGGVLHAVAPGGAPTAAFTYAVTTDTTAPAVALAPLPRQSRDRLPQALAARVTDASGADSVWLEYRVDARPLQSALANASGADSFVVTLPSGLAAGQRIAYRVAARDRARAPHVGYSNAAFDTLLVTHDWYDDFAHPSNYFHFNGLFSWRDLWHIDAAPPLALDGAAWHCGSSDGSPYAPHTDANLYSPYVYDVTPGTQLRFDHRFVLEQEDENFAFDAARLEVSVDNGPWQIAQPTDGYSHEMDEGGMPFTLGSPCWSGDSHGWITSTFDLGHYGPGPLRVRWRMCADDLVGEAGWWVDRVRVLYPDDVELAVTPDAPRDIRASAAWPSPAREQLHVALTLPRAATIDWALYDVQGRRVATLWQGSRAAGSTQLDATFRMSPGLYFARLQVDGAVVRTSRVVTLE